LDDDDVGFASGVGYPTHESLSGAAPQGEALNMASILWRREKQVTVYYFDANKGRSVQLPRKETKHLDGLPPEQVRKWVDDWERAHGRTRDRSERVTLAEDDRLSRLWNQYQKEKMRTGHRRPSTEAKETEYFEKHICPFFITLHQKKNPADWHRLVPAFHDSLYDKKLADSTIGKILWTLERFGAQLVYSGEMSFPFVVKIPSRGNSKITPLKVRKKPDEIIKFAKRLVAYEGTEIDFNLAILLAYFAALSPGELFALDKEDLLTGQDAESSKTLEALRKKGLGSRLAISVSKTLPTGGKNNRPVKFTKNDYRTGVVTIWHLEAAKLIASMVKKKPSGRLFPYSYGHLSRFWREKVKLGGLGLTPHDLRRASCLYLGRTIRLDLTLLQEHMRHSQIDTTMLYTREPAVPEIASRRKQDFDDVE
jgi:integrase